MTSKAGFNVQPTLKGQPSQEEYAIDAIGADGTITDTTIIWGGNADNDDPNRDTMVSNDGATGTTR